MELRLTTPPGQRTIRPVLFDDEEQVVELVSRYLRTLAESAKGYSLRTIELYGRQLTHFCEYLTTDERYGRLQPDHVLATIPGGVIDQYLTGLRQEGFEDSTVRTRDVILKGFFEWLTTNEAGKVRDSSGYENGLKSSSGRRKMPRFVTKEHVIVLLSNLHNECQRCLVHFIYDTGLRVSEVPRVMKDDIDALDHWPTRIAYLPLLVRGSKGRGGSNIKERYTLISRATFSRIKRYHNTPAYRFTQTGGPKPAFLTTHRLPVKPTAIQKWIAGAAKRAGFPPRTISPHRLRHGTALSILRGEAGKGYMEKLVLIQKQFGHSSIRATESYTNIPPSLFATAQNDEDICVRFEEAQEIYERTYLPANKHRERRGHTSR